MHYMINKKLARHHKICFAKKQKPSGYGNKI